jgi:hypothetical protein
MILLKGVQRISHRDMAFPFHDINVLKEFVGMLVYALAVHVFAFGQPKDIYPGMEHGNTPFI